MKHLRIVLFALAALLLLALPAYANQGKLRVGTSTTKGYIWFTDGAGHYEKILVGSLSGDVTFTLPTADGTSGQSLVTDGSGGLSFVTGTGAITITSGNVPYASGTNTLGQDTGLSYAASTDTFTLGEVAAGSSGKLKLLGLTSGNIIITVADAAGSGTWTVPTGTDTFVGKATTDTLTNKTLTGAALTAGSTTVAPLTYNSGTNLTTAAAGATEFDGKAFYDDALASSRQVRVDEQFIRLTSPFTLTSATTQQKLFNAPTGGALSVAAGTTYEFDCQFTVSSMSATSGNLKFSPAGTGVSGATATITNCTYDVYALDATLATPAAPSYSVLATTTGDPITSSTDIAAATTATVCGVHAHGIITINAAGTIIPSVSLTTAAAAVVDINSHFDIWPIGSGTVQSVGNWN